MHESIVISTADSLEAVLFHSFMQFKAKKSISMLDKLSLREEKTGDLEKTGFGKMETKKKT